MQNQGNEALKTGLKHRKKFYFREAITAYSKGLDEHSGDSRIESLLLSNRAHVHLLLGNDRNALEDSLAALKLDGHNQKVCTVLLSTRQTFLLRHRPVTRCPFLRPI